MAYPPPQYGREPPPREPPQYGGRDPYMTSGPVTNQPSGYYPTYPGSSQPPPPQQKPSREYDNRGYREEPRYYDDRGPVPRGGGGGGGGGGYKPPAPPAPMLPDALPAGHRGREWRNGLFGCTNNPKQCVCVWCCLPFYGCYRGHEFGESALNWCPCCLPLTVMGLRQRIRERENIQGTLMGDCAATVFCTGCAICQLYSENDLARGGGAQDLPPMGAPMDRY